MLQKEKDREDRKRLRGEALETCGGMNVGHWAGLGCTVTARPGLGLARRDMTDWLVQLIDEILLNCIVGTGRSYGIHMEVQQQQKKKKRSHLDG